MLKQVTPRMEQRPPVAYWGPRREWAKKGRRLNSIRERSVARLRVFPWKRSSWARLVLARWGLVLLVACSREGNEAEERPESGSSSPEAEDSPLAPGGPGTSAAVPTRSVRPVDGQGQERAGARPEPPFRPVVPALDPGLRRKSIPEQQEYLLELLRAQEQPAPEAYGRIEAVIHGSEWLGFGNPKVADPVLDQTACWALWKERAPLPADASCGHPNMVRIAGSHACIDQYEFPNVLCEYPVVWVRSSEASSLCEALGKRLCDAHEWEGACAGEVHSPEEEYSYSRLPKGQGAEYRRARRMLMESWHNLDRRLVWAYGPEKNHALCGTGARKSARCTTVDWGICGTNDYPAGSFPECHSVGGVYDQHGNAAEHMSLPLFPEQLGGRGDTEMKGSWFLFAREETHPDDCRWRARNWHTTKIGDPNSHRNYHLGFRCCSDSMRPGP